LNHSFDESAELVASFGEEFGLGFPLLLDPGGKIQQQYKVRGYPTTVVLDREGRIQSYHVGILTRSQLDGYLESAGLSQ
jgi:peroxiredoxin